jgi:hypothetical protein
LDPDPDPGWPRDAQRCFEELWMAEGFSWCLRVLSRRLRRNLQRFSYSNCPFFQFLVINPFSRVWIQIHKMEVQQFMHIREIEVLHSRMLEAVQFLYIREMEAVPVPA